MGRAALPMGRAALAWGRVTLPMGRAALPWAVLQRHGPCCAGRFSSLTENCDRCSMPFYLDRSTAVCQPRKDDAAGCSDSAECKSGVCKGGHCCSSSGAGSGGGVGLAAAVTSCSSQTGAPDGCVDGLVLEGSRCVAEECAPATTPEPCPSCNGQGLPIRSAEGVCRCNCNHWVTGDRCDEEKLCPNSCDNGGTVTGTVRDSNCGCDCANTGHSGPTCAVQDACPTCNGSSAHAFDVSCYTHQVSCCIYHAFCCIRHARIRATERYAIVRRSHLHVQTCCRRPKSQQRASAKPTQHVP
jgi:hypothetical protein